MCYPDKLVHHFPIMAVKKVVDRTATGDSYNGVYTLVPELQGLRLVKQ